MTTRPQGKTYYAVLGIPPTANEAEIQRAYDELQKVVGEIIDPQQRAARLQQLQQAYETLMSPVRRSVYDASLQAGQAATIELSKAESVRTARQGGTPVWLMLGGTLLLAGFAFAGWKLWAKYAADREYRDTFRIAQRQADTLRAEAEHLIAREAEQTQRYAPASQDPDYEARRAQEARDRDYAAWTRQKGYEAESASRRAQYEAEMRASRAEREANQQEERSEREARHAQERVERERQYMLNKLINERRFDEARNIAKTSYELDRIRQMEK
ncbi:DnaJ domain-containing protein [Chitinimonas sp. BJYL2]|uniref:J domain-containing protein n=1 Tax=Chitinimonas sp. BJYL2 TaxID=2976696 RepID=UPI0022B4D9F3|nr:DnaJ domain-containing protein [Chitinimonas sp. BJYL2]